MPTPLFRTLRGKIDPADSENDNESIDYENKTNKTHTKHTKIQIKCNVHTIQTWAEKNG